MMFKKICTLSALCVLLAFQPAWGLDLEPGKYRITIRMEVPGMPGGMPPQTMTQCLNEQHPVPGSSFDPQGCKMTDMRTQGNTVSYMIACNQPGMEAEIFGEMFFKGDSFDGSTKTIMGPEAGGMTLITLVTGKRIGKCE